MPFATVAREIDSRLGLQRESHLSAPSAEDSVRRLLEKLIAACANVPVGQDPAASDSSERELGLPGSIQSLQFMGVADHGIDRDTPDASLLKHPPRLTNTPHWEVYDIKQDRGSSVWLVAVSPDGLIRRIEVAVR
jgi:hypothetical protein